MKIEARTITTTTLHVEISLAELFRNFFFAADNAVACDPENLNIEDYREELVGIISGDPLVIRGAFMDGYTMMLLDEGFARVDAALSSGMSVEIQILNQDGDEITTVNDTNIDY